MGNSLMSAFDLKPNGNISRLVHNFDYVFTFLVINRLESGVDVDCCLNGAKHASIGGDYCDECDYWSDLVESALSDKKQVDKVKAEIKKDFSCKKGRFCDVAVAILA